MPTTWNIKKSTKFLTGYQVKIIKRRTKATKGIIFLNWPVNYAAFCSPITVR
jgi:hypothetical protein